MTLDRVTIYDRGGGILQRVIQADPRPDSGDGGGWLIERRACLRRRHEVIRNMPDMPAMIGRHAGRS